MNIFAIFGLTVWITSTSLIILVLKFGDFKKRIHVVLTLLNTAISIWGLGCMMVGLSGSNASHAVFWWKFAHVGGLLIPVFVLHCAVLVANVHNKWILIAAYLQAIVFEVSSVIDLMGARLDFVLGSYYKLTSTNIIYALGCVGWCGVALCANIILFYGYFHSSGIKKVQLKYLIIAIMFGLWGGGTHFLSVFNVNTFSYAMFLIPVFTFLTTYAILRHQFLDINIVIKKTIVYSSLVSLLTMAYLAIVYLLENTFRGVVGYQSIPLTVVTIACFSIAFTPLKNRIQGVVDRYFFKGTIDQIEKENTMLELAVQRSERLKAVSTLAAGMAHEIKNPLTSIKTFAEYAKSKHNDPNFMAKFDQIVPSEIAKIQNIVNQLLDYSKTEKTNIKEHDIRDILDYVLDLYSNDSLKKGISVDRRYEAYPVKVACDANQMKQVFINLVLNSIEAMPKGGKLTVSTGVTDGTLEIVLQDTGEGIPEEKLTNLFDAFYTTKDTGTGLGLFIAHQIVENNNGKILIDSEVNKGTIVKIVFEGT